MNFERPLVTDMNPSAGGPRFGNGWRGDENEDTMEVSHHNNTDAQCAVKYRKKVQFLERIF